jgi:hypothetical protein
MSKVRQMRGPGMNKGLKKPRHGFTAAQPKPAKKSSGSSERKDYKKGSMNTSLLSQELAIGRWRGD